MICLVLPCLLTRWTKIFLRNPHTWEAKSITRFMVWMGPISSAFDILTFSLLYFIICTHDNRSSLCSWSGVCRRIHCLVSDRLVYRVHVVPKHGNLHASFSKIALCSKSTSFCCHGNDPIGRALGYLLTIWPIGFLVKSSATECSLFPITSGDSLPLYGKCHPG